MHLKTLTLRGFKSFASATTLAFEPGVTCVVGPNGSGKSNVVDALAWVMGEQGAKTLRGGKMEDVIFAGTRTRPALGRAEVRLTIDNTDGALPIDYAEVTVSRTLFRNGGSEYAINGSPCRLLDIQELLSDTGMGREMHVIVGQGQLDAILTATPEERRGFIEEAAGVLKHRKRKERAVRKLDAMQANLTRLQDLTSEIRRQLGPLAKQADVARRAQVVQAELRDARARLLADDLVQLTATLEAEVADETALAERRTEVDQQLAVRRAELARLEQLTAQAAPAISEASEVYFRLSSLRERLRATASVATERSRLLGASEAPRAAADPDELAEQAARLRSTERELALELDGHRAALEDQLAARREAEAAADAAERAYATEQRAIADRREGLATLAGAVAASRSRLEAHESEVGRLRDALEAAKRREAEAEGEFQLLETTIAGAEEGEVSLDRAHEQASAELALATEELARLTRELSELETERTAFASRRDALALSLTRKDGAGALLAAPSGQVSLFGSLAALLEIEPGYESAIAAALGPAAEAVAVPSLPDAVDAIRYLRTEDAGRARFVVGCGHACPSVATRPGELPAAALWARDLVTCPADLTDAIDELLAGVAVVADLPSARDLLAQHPQLTAVTRAGDVLGAHWADGGSAAGPSVLQLQAELEAAEQGLSSVAAEIERHRFERSAAEQAQREASERAEVTLAQLNESDARLAAVAERLGELGAAGRAARAEAERADAALAAASEAVAAEQAKLADLADRLERARVASPGDAPAEADPSERDRTAAAARQARGLETEARLALRTAEERMRALSARAESVEHAAEVERAAQARARELAERRRVAASKARAVALAADDAGRRIERAVAQAADKRAELEAERAERDMQMSQLRAAIDALAAELAELTDVAHKDEVARAQQRLRIEQLQDRALADLGIDPDVLVEEFGPHLPVPPPPLGPGETEPDPPRQPEPYTREAQNKRLKRCERALSLLGRVNPLALEEYAALEERHQFLATQLADLKKSRADLLDVVKEVDERVERVFTEAYRDTETAFEQVFATLFPGGHGKLVLTDPENMLLTGVDVEAKPAGKQVKRLSLLSGGERSLVAVAFMIAIFKARPSPFYVMDEVEAALDDTNLGRLIEIFQELRRDSQIIIVTHQKRTMQIADALYGVTMRGDGITQVISQRLRDEDAEAEPEPAA